GDFFGAFLGLDFDGYVDRNRRQFLLQRDLQPGRIGAYLRRIHGRVDGRGTAANNQDVQWPPVFYGVLDLGKAAFAGEQIVRNQATLYRRRRWRILGVRGQRGRNDGQHKQAQDEPGDGLHPPPPAISALPMVPLVLDPLLSAYCLYHESSHAAPDMIRIPQILITKCNPAPPENSASRKCPAKARKTPRQKISSECCPHRISGRSQGDFSPTQSLGRKRTVTAASARKWAKRSTSRSVLLIGYIHCSSRRGITWPSWGKYHVRVTKNANKRYATEIHTVTGEESIRAMRCAPPCAH